MHRLISAAGLLVSITFHVTAQTPAVVVLKNKLRYDTDIVLLTDSILVTKSGNFNFTKIDTVRFTRSASDDFAQKLIRNNVVVIRKDGGALSPAEPTHSSSIGIGGGVDYGGLGARIAFYPNDAFGLYLAAGYPLMMRVAWNAGIVIRILPSKRVTPVGVVMYGMNAAIVVFEGGDYNKVYNGFTAGIGLDSKSRRTRGNYFSFRLLRPSRSDQFEKDWNSLKQNPNIVIRSKPWPLIFSVGFHYPLVKTR